MTSGKLQLPFFLLSQDPTTAKSTLKWYPPYPEKRMTSPTDETSQKEEKTIPSPCLHHPVGVGHLFPKVTTVFSASHDLN